MPREHIKWKVNIVSDNGLVPSGNKLLPESMMTLLFVAILCNPPAMSSTIELIEMQEHLFQIMFFNIFSVYVSIQTD